MEKVSVTSGCPAVFFIDSHRAVSGETDSGIGPFPPYDEVALKRGILRAMSQETANGGNNGSQPDICAIGLLDRVDGCEQVRS